MDMEAIRPLLDDFRIKVQNSGQIVYVRSTVKPTESVTSCSSGGYVVEREVIIKSSLNCAKEEVVKSFFRLGVARPLPAKLRKRFLDETGRDSVRPIDTRLAYMVHEQEKINRAVVDVLNFWNNRHNLTESLRYYRDHRWLLEDEVKEFGPVRAQQQYCSDVLNNFLPTPGRSSYGWLEVSEDPFEKLVRPKLALVVQRDIHA